MPSIARITDLHAPPMGMIVGPGVPNVMVGGLPAAAMGDLVVFFGPKPPGNILLGSGKVMVGGRPLAYTFSPTTRGSLILTGHFAAQTSP